MSVQPLVTLNKLFRCDAILFFVFLMRKVGTLIKHLVLRRLQRDPL